MTQLPKLSPGRTRDIVYQIARQCDVAPDMIEDAYPCTPYQADLFKTGTPGAGVLHYNFVFRLQNNTPGMIDRICKAFESVHRRNPVLCSRIVQYQYPDPDRPCIAQALVKNDFEWLEFGDLDQYCHERTGHRLRYGEQLVHYGISKDRKYLVWTLHHAIYDGWSITLLWKELCDTMSAERDQLALTQRPKYVKFITQLQTPTSEVSRRFWFEHLADYTGPRFRQRRLSPETDACRNGSLSLVDLRENSINVTARIQAAWFCTLVELYGNLDVMTLIVATGRNSEVEGVADMSGSCMCIVPFRQRVKLLAPLHQFMLDLEKRSGELLAHEHAGMESLQSLVGEARQPIHTFNIKSGLEGNFADFSGLDYQPTRGLKEERDWLVAISIGEETLRWDLHFDSNRLDQAAVKLICERFPKLLQTCLTLKSHDRVALEDVIDVRRLSYNL